MDKKVRTRSLLLGLFFTLLFLGIIGKIYWVQIVDASWLQVKAEEIWKKTEILRATRGTIMDRNDKPLAEDAAAYTVALSPQIIVPKKLEREVAHGLADILKTSSDPADLAKLEEKIVGMATQKRPDSDKLMVEVPIRNEGWKIDGETKQKVADFIQSIETRTGFKDIGVYTKEEAQKRYYPYNSLASHILGYMDKEGKAIPGGLESSLNSILSGTNGELIHEKDGKGVELPDSKVTFTTAINGKNIRLTIDQNIQFYLESALQKSFDIWHPKSMTAIAVDPKTMEILGMANMPNFNPNRYWEAKSQSDFINHAVSSQYEIGSTFKIVTLAGTVEEGMFNPNETYVSGSINVPGRTLHDHNNVGWGRITFMEGLLRSSNVAFVKLGYERLKEEKLKNYIDKFGFGVKTGVDLPGEIPGIVSMKYPSDFATATYGQGKVAITAMQLTAAYGAIANNGKLMWPHIIKDIIDPQTSEVIQSFQPTDIRQVVSADTAKQTTLYLEQVVANQDIGTGKKAYINGYRVAGKTGTANLVVAGEKGYSNDKWVISFVGYAPVEDPKILVTVIADEPDLKGDYHKGGDVAAPVFKEIVSQALRYMNVPSTSVQAKAAALEPLASIPNVSNLTVGAAKSAMNQVGLKADVFGSGSKIVKQFPPPGTEISMSQRIYLATQQDESLKVPDLTGKSLRDSMEVCAMVNLQCKISGEGYVANQTLSGEGDQKLLALELKPLSNADGDPAANTKDSSKKVVPLPTLNKSPDPVKPKTAANTSNNSKKVAQ